MVDLETKVIYGKPEDSYFLTFSKIITACLGIKPDCSYKVLMYACAKCDDHQMVRMDNLFRQECMDKMDISWATYDKARKALISANILKPQKYRGIYRINEAIAWKGTARERKRLFEDGLVAKITIEAVPKSEAKYLD